MIVMIKEYNVILTYLTRVEALAKALDKICCEAGCYNDVEIEEIK